MTVAGADGILDVPELASPDVFLEGMPVVEKALLDLSRLLYEVPAVLLAIGIHEYFHAMAAFRLGDPTAQEMGLLNINPFPRIDPLGLLMFLWFNYGWTKDTPVDHRRLGSRGRSVAVLAAGAVGNVALVALFLLVLLLKKPEPEGYMYNFVGHSIVVNLNMALVNLLPLPPMDGGRVAALFWPPYGRWVFPGAVLLALVSLTEFSRMVQGISYALLRLVS